MRDNPRDSDGQPGNDVRLIQRVRENFPELLSKPYTITHSASCATLLPGNPFTKCDCFCELRSGSVVCR